MPRKALTNMEASLDERVAVDPLPLSYGKPATIEYKGLLAQSGADKIYLHYGYGHDAWTSTGFKPMVNSDGAWVTTLTVDKKDTFNFCFKDSANNWDNNSGRNWSATVS